MGIGTLIKIGLNTNKNFWRGKVMSNYTNFLAMVTSQNKKLLTSPNHLSILVHQLNTSSKIYHHFHNQTIKGIKDKNGSLGLSMAAACENIAMS